MRDLLVHVSRYDDWSNSLRYAGLLAATLKASVTGLHCVESMSSPVVRSTGASVETNADGVIEAAWAMEESFRCYMGSLGVRHSDWVVHDGGVIQALAHMGQWHDLVVLGSGGITLRHPQAALARTLLVSRLTCLVVPETWASPGHPACIAVAWDGSISALRALHAALPLLVHAGRVVLLMGGRHDSVHSASQQPAFDLDRYCERHDLDIDRVRLDPPEAQTGASLLEAALAANAELLVLGASGRTQMSQRLFGGVNQHVLQHSQIPLLLRH